MTLKKQATKEDALMGFLFVAALMWGVNRSMSNNGVDAPEELYLLEVWFCVIRHGRGRGVLVKTSRSLSIVF